MELFISKIQRFSTADGPGIRSTVFLQGCNLRCAWCHNPETQAQTAQTLHFRGERTEISGVVQTVDSVFDEIMRDEQFYITSGGGVTVSGGEPLLQAEAVAILLEKLKNRGVSTIVDTAGAVEFSAFKKVLKYTDLFYYDLKGDKRTYKKYIGGSFKLVYDNLIDLKRLGANVRIRMPLIYGVNTDKKNLESISELMFRAKVREIDILPYHKYGVAKYEALGISYEMSDKKRVPANIIRKTREFFAEKGFNVKIEKN